jgi:hypothetical protein
MRVTLRFAGAAVAAFAVAGLVGFGAAEEEKPKYTIKQVMGAAHKEGLLKKVVSGQASDDEKKQLLELYSALGHNKPPRGDAADWKKRTDGMVAAAKDVTTGKEGAEKKLGKTVDCKGCHQLHKGP